MTALLQGSLLFGLLLSLLLTLVIGISLAVNPEIWVNDYPPDIRAKHGPMSEKARRQRIPVGILFFLVVFGVVVAAVARFAAGAPEPPSFVDLYFYIFLILMVFNLYDLLVLDWLFFVTLRPKAVILPGTEGLPGYRDYAFHFRGFLVGIGFSAVGALLLAALAWGFLRLVG